MSANLPAEQGPDPVADALRMRASDADREKVASILRDAYVEGRLTAVEHEERLAEVYRAMTYGELIPVMRDLPVPPGTLAVPTANSLAVTPPGTPTVPATRTDAGIVVNSALAGMGDNSLVAIFGGFERKGGWTVPAELSALCIFGGGELDLTDAVLTGQETVITAVCLFGGLEITVPEGMAVRSEVVGIFGGTEVPRTRECPAHRCSSSRVLRSSAASRSTGRRSRRSGASRSRDDWPLPTWPLTPRVATAGTSGASARDDRGRPCRFRPIPSRLAALTLCGLLALTGCSSSSESAASDAPAGSGGSDELAAVQAFAALPRAEQEQEMRSLTASMDRQLMTMSGLEAELGGAAQADTAYAAVSAGILDLAQGFVDQPDFGRFGARVVAEDAPSMGGLMFGNLMIAALAQDAAVSSTNDIPPGKPAAETKDMSDPASGGEGAMKVTGDAAKGSLDVGGTVTVGGVTGTLKTLITVAPCPDAKGQFTSTTTMTASVTSAGGSTGSNLTVEVTIKGQVDDDAQLVSYDVDTRTQSAEFANSKGMYADQTVGWTVGGSGWSDYRSKVNRTGGKVTDAFVAEQGRWGQLMAAATMDKAVEAAKKGWESGRCVVLEPTTSPGKRTGLKPSAAVTITAAPRSKIDGTAVGGTVMATLNGGSSVDPAGSKVPADATFAYVAPGEKDKSATVSFEARSKRGVAKAHRLRHQGRRLRAEGVDRDGARRHRDHRRHLRRDQALHRRVDGRHGRHHHLHADL